MLEKARQMRWIQGFRVGTNAGNTITISHLLYVDDTLIFCEAEKAKLLYLNVTLLLFEALSGLHINKLKSTIYPVNNVNNIEELAGTMGCSIGALPIQLEAKFKNCEIWNGVVEKFIKRLATWQMQYLSMGGRLTLISSVLDIIPTYYMSLFPIPKKVLKQLDKIRRDFLWEGNNNSHKFHLIKWDSHTAEKQWRIGGQRFSNPQQKYADEVAMEVWYR
uniref:Uncharacterized protein n=1 Tax=Nicotiana tabacum TaxID=4097 RepID=A0A1S3Y6E1_TOBAC|nr:PREDICTED: uncharacterized protein LOC107772491 [Nicotiana tabacum]